jgi:hypothetical protein
MLLVHLSSLNATSVDRSPERRGLLTLRGRLSNLGQKVVRVGYGGPTYDVTARQVCCAFGRRLAMTIRLFRAVTRPRGVRFVYYVVAPRHTTRHVHAHSGRPLAIPDFRLRGWQWANWRPGTWGFTLSLIKLSIGSLPGDTNMGRGLRLGRFPTAGCHRVDSIIKALLGPRSFRSSRRSSLTSAFQVTCRSALTPKRGSALLVCQFGYAIVDLVILRLP